MKLYLCGGMHNGWQDRVVKELPEHQCLDPRSHGLKDEKEYTAWDLRAIREADGVLAYMDNDNPSGYGLNLEIGYAHALGKPIYLVCEHLGFRHKYFGMARVCSTCFPTLEEALTAIRRTYDQPTCTDADGAV